MEGCDAACENLEPVRYLSRGPPLVLMFGGAEYDLDPGHGDRALASFPVRSPPLASVHPPVSHRVAFSSTHTRCTLHLITTGHVGSSSLFLMRSCTALIQVSVDQANAILGVDGRQGDLSRLSHQRMRERYVGQVHVGEDNLLLVQGIYDSAHRLQCRYVRSTSSESLLRTSVDNGVSEKLVHEHSWRSRSPSAPGCTCVV